MTDTAGPQRAGPPVLDFSGSRLDGWPVSTPDGAVAWTEVSFWSSGFTGRDANGSPLCSGKITGPPLALVQTRRRMVQRRRGAASAANA